MEQVHLRASTLSLAFAEHLQHTLERIDDGLTQAGARWKDNPASVPSAVKHLQDVLPGQIFQLQIYQANGDLRFDFAEPNTVHPLRASLDPRWMQAYAMQDRMFVQGTNSQLGTPQRQIVQFTRPIFKGSQFVGLIVLAIDPGALTRFSQKLDSTTNTVIAVLESRGQLIAQSVDSPQRLSQSLVERAAHAVQTSTNSPFVGTLVDDDSERTVGIYSIPKYDLAVLVGIDTARQMAPDRTRKHIVLLFAVLFPVLLLAATRMILQSLARRESMEKSMRDSERLAASVFTHAREGIIITDISGYVLDVNSTFTAITGFDRADVIGHMPRMLQSDRQSPEFYAALWQELESNGHWSGDIWSRRANGEIFAALLTISTVRDAVNLPQHYVALFTDITDVKDHQRQLAHMAHYDSLSSLPNRVLLGDRLRQAMLQCQRRNKLLAVAFLDLDGFKEVNDHYGHDVGDGMLIAVAQNMNDALREGDTLARIGGDEFVVVITDLDHKDDCYPTLDRLLAAAHTQTAIRDKKGGAHNEVLLQVSASIGFTFYPQEDVDADQLLRQADQAMYQAKQAGKNRYHLFDVIYDAALKTQTESIERIRQALVNEEFVLHYQPKVNMASGQVIGAEALIRWMHPERGILAPLQFLPIIENHLLSITLGEWVINTALKQMAQWQLLKLNLCISVNISARQLQQDSFSTRLSELLASHPTVMPDQLELEILETSAMEDMAKVTENIHRCHALGVRFSLDDFGTGYSSLTYLKRLPAETLKIDQSFVRDMLDDADDLAIVESIIGLANAFQRSVIAEGVESPAHGALLMRLGCNLAQGYGIAKPMPEDQLPDWVAQWRPNFGHPPGNGGD
jgi:diguanylate cyclase (GGDEF)-like protein/PAS domain S-box-containing protein